MSRAWQRLCLHAVNAKHQAQLLGVVKRLLPTCRTKAKLKEKYFRENDMYKCRVTAFKPSDSDAYRVECAWGVLLVADKLINVADITLYFVASERTAMSRVQELLQGLLSGKLSFVLEEPSLARRVELLRGRYCLDELAEYDGENAASALLCHLPWHIYALSHLWEQLLATQGVQRGLWRQLRVKLRRLRSFLALMRPLTDRERTRYWLRTLKERAQLLAAVREYDVLLLICSRLRSAEGVSEQENAVPHLHMLLETLRAEEQSRSLRDLRLNALTMELARLLLFVLEQGSVKRSIGMREFFTARLSVWSGKLLALPQRYDDLQDMEQLHKVRIKLKRFRYALQAVPEVEADPLLLRRLRIMQDLLGLLHDDYVNGRYLQELLAQQGRSEELRYEVALLRGWEQAKADAAAQQLSERWQELCELLHEARERWQ